MKILYLIEKFGNKLPDPSFLFVVGTFLIFIFSAIMSNMQYSVLDPNGNTIIVKNLMSSDGVWWFLSSMIENFVLFPPLGIVLVGMLGIGFAEKTGFIPALLDFIIHKIHEKILTPITIFL